MRARKQDALRLGSILFFAAMALAPPAHASSVCEFYKKFIPSLYKVNCTGGRKTKPSASGATFADSFSVNPASVPTDPTPYGIESLNSSLRDHPSQWSSSFSLIKGFRKFGTGVSTAGGNTFYSNDVVRRTRARATLDSFASLEPSKNKAPNFSFGTSFALGGKSDAKTSGFSLGLTGKYNRVTDTFGGGLGLIYRRAIFSFGVGMTRERVSNLAGATYFQSAFVSAHLWALELEYTVLKSFGAFDLPPVQIGTATLNFGPVMLAAATRRLHYALDGTVMQHHWAIQIFPSRKFSVGYLYNYIPGANTIAAQLYL